MYKCGISIITKLWFYTLLRDALHCFAMTGSGVTKTNLMGVQMNRELYADCNDDEIEYKIFFSPTPRYTDKQLPSLIVKLTFHLLHASLSYDDTSRGTELRKWV